MNIYRQRDIVLIPFPFSDLSTRKVRPVLVLSNDAYNRRTEDLLVCGLTANLRPLPYSVIIETVDVEVAGTLRHKGKIKADTLVSLSQNLVIKPIARLKPDIFDRVTAEILQLIQRIGETETRQR